MSQESPALHIVRPNLGTQTLTNSTSPIKVSIQSPLLLQLLESVYNTNEDKRIIGTLLGSRSDDGSEIEVKDAYIVPHEEDGEEVIITDNQHKALYQLHKRASPKEVIVGWFAINSQIDSFTGLIHSFYSSAEGTKPYPAIHLTVDTINKTTGELITPIINTFIGSQVGATGRMATALNLERSGSFIFTPIANEVKLDDSELVALKWLRKAALNEDQRVQLPIGSSSELRQLSDEINNIDQLIDQVSNYVDGVLKGDLKGDELIGKFLLENLNHKPNSISNERLEKLFNTHVQDTLMIEYLASSIKSQLELSAKLTNIIQE